MISIIIPACNEESVIGRVLDEIRRVMDGTKIDYEIIVVDDGSTDKTSCIVKDKKVTLIRHQYNRGYGASLKTGIKSAKGELILITDADGTYPGKDIPKLLKYAEEYDMVVGARIGEDVNISWHRKPGKFILSKLADYLSGVRIPDLNSGFRVFKKNVALEFFHLFPAGFSFTTTITLACLSDDYTVKYVPINYYKREGKSKISPFKDGFDLILLIIRTIVYFNPLKVFIPASILLFLIAVFVAIYSIAIMGKFMDITVLIITMTSIQTAFIGLLADLIIKRSDRIVK